MTFTLPYLTIDSSGSQSRVHWRITGIIWQLLGNQIRWLCLRPAELETSLGAGGSSKCVSISPLGGFCCRVKFKPLLYTATHLPSMLDSQVQFSMWQAASLLIKMQARGFFLPSPMWIRVSGIPLCSEPGCQTSDAWKEALSPTSALNISATDPLSAYFYSTKRWHGSMGEYHLWSRIH